MQRYSVFRRSWRAAALRLLLAAALGLRLRLQGLQLQLQHTPLPLPPCSRAEQKAPDLFLSPDRLTVTRTNNIG